MSSLPQPAPLVPVEADLNRLAEAAWIIDLDASRVIAASPAGRALWSGALRDGTTLDRAMPGMQDMMRLAGSGECGAGPGEERTLLLWAAQGLVRLRCRCRPLDRDGRKVLVVAAADASDAAASAAPDAATGDRARATLAHELRTPLSAIAALAEVMKDERLGPMGNTRYLGYASDIHDSARHALSVLVAMLEGGTGCQGAQEPAETDVHGTVSRCLSAMRELAGQASVRLQSELAPGRPRLAADRRSLMQILLNLLSNALKFTPQGGVVTVATRREPGGGLVLSVTDTGTGMHRDEIERLQAEDDGPGRAAAARGSGYGLPLVKALARESGARLEIASPPGQGTRVSIVFPRDRLIGAEPAPA
ncbi:MAG: HAMP domain-containing histidine kinase [Hyphomicrobiaceae bacterium]|nr:HAMP domain-containing histidine kinase [Hyphomicrobiaceae bacterium]